MTDGKPWPKISIVTPSYNQGQFLEETIRSVLLQGYPNLEYIITDGGSTDNSVEIIKKYEPWLTYWVSEKDNGQADAIHRGFVKATGEIIGWLNSDDYYLPNAFSFVINRFLECPDSEQLVGGYWVCNENGLRLKKIYSFPQTFESILCAGQLFGQMATFWKRKAYFEVGGLDRSLQYCMDYELFIKLAKRKKPTSLREVVSVCRHHSATKSMTIVNQIGVPECERILIESGISKLSIEEKRNIATKEHKKYIRNQLSGLIHDLYKDPKYIWTTIKRITKKLRILAQKMA